MNKIGTLFLLVTLAACNHHPDFSSIRPGMTSDEVVKKLGRPGNRKPMVESEWWLYDDAAKHVVIIRNDTVVNCTTQGEAMHTMEVNLRMMDSLKTNASPKP